MINLAGIKLIEELDSNEPLVKNESFGAYLRALRKGKKLSCKALATNSGFSSPYISKLESGYCRPTKKVLNCLADPLGVSPEHLMIEAGFSDNEILEGTTDPEENIEITKTLFALKRYNHMMNTIADFTFSEANKIEGMSAFDIVNAHGGARAGEHGHEQYQDVTANAVVLHEKRKVIYIFYTALTQTIRTIIGSIEDPHESLVAKLLFLDGWKYAKAQQYCEHGYYKDVYPIAATTFADKRRGAVGEIAERLLNFGILDLIEHNEKSKDGFRFVLTSWTDQPD